MARTFDKVNLYRLDTGLRRFADDKDVTLGTRGLLNRLRAIPQWIPYDKVSVEGLRRLANLPATATRDEIETTYRTHQAPLLNELEQKGAALIFDVLNTPTEFAPDSPEYNPVITYGPRTKSFKVDEAIEILKQKRLVAADGSMQAWTHLSIGAWDRRPQPSGYSVSVSSVKDLLNRIASTPPGSNDGDKTNLTPDMLKTSPIEGDPFSDDGVNEVARDRLSESEKLVASYIYAQLFVPPAIIPEQQTTKTLVTEVGDGSTAPAKISLSFGSSVYATSSGFEKRVAPGYVYIEAPPGTELLLGSGNELEGQSTIDSVGNASFPASPGGEFTAVILQDPDGMGVLQPRVVGRVAIKIPKTITAPVQAS